MVSLTTFSVDVLLVKDTYSLASKLIANSSPGSHLHPSLSLREAVRNLTVAALYDRRSRFIAHYLSRRSQSAALILSQFQDPRGERGQRPGTGSLAIKTSPDLAQGSKRTEDTGRFEKKEESK